MKWKIFDRGGEELVILKRNHLKDSIRNLWRKYPLFSLDFITAGEKVGNVIMEDGKRPALRRITFDLSEDRQRKINRRLVISLIPLLDGYCNFRRGRGC